MRRPRREFTVFSLAAIDLFCSAMGAFMIISIVLIPYYGRSATTPTPPDTTKLAREKEEAEQKVKDLQKDMQRLEKEMSRNATIALFGIVTHANSITILVDLSGSIHNTRTTPPGRDYRPIVRHVCATIVDGMKPNQKLQIIGFHTPGPNYDTPVLRPWQSGPVPLNASTAGNAKAFVNRILDMVDGGTPTYPALTKALADEDEAIFLITDGAPNDGKREGEGLCNEIAESIARQNHGRKEIHCIAVGEYNSEPYCTNFLMRLARENQGQFLGMPNL